MKILNTQFSIINIQLTLTSILYPVSCILYLVSCILHPLFILPKHPPQRICNLSQRAITFNSLQY